MFMSHYATEVCKCPRKRQGLTGDAAVKHYNEWMDRHGMSHLKVPYLT